MGCSSSMGVDGRGVHVYGKVVVVCRVIFFFPLLPSSSSFFFFSLLVLLLRRYLSVTCSVTTPETLALRRTSAKTSILEEDERCNCIVIICSTPFVLPKEGQQDCRGNYLPERYSCQLLHTFKSTFALFVAVCA